ncbi:MAG TPA: hypothetical protein PK694_08960 [Rhodospirillales bacterium]|nr:hypothetical protein [Rhodospirillales bacterium]
MQRGFVMRTPRGRALAPEGYRCLGLPPVPMPGQLDLLSEADDD